MTRKSEHRSYNGEATWDDFPCVSANIYTSFTLHHIHTYGERERRREKKKKKERKKKERKRELGKFNSCHLKLKLEIKQGIHLKILKFKHM